MNDYRNLFNQYAEYLQPQDMSITMEYPSKTRMLQRFVPVNERGQYSKMNPDQTFRKIALKLHPDKGGYAADFTELKGMRVEGESLTRTFDPIEYKKLRRMQSFGEDLTNLHTKYRTFIKDSGNWNMNDYIDSIRNGHSLTR